MGLYCMIFAVDAECVNELNALKDDEDAFHELLNSKDPERRSIYLDKAWHAIHFLLTGEAWDCEHPGAFMICGGTDVLEDFDGNTRTFDPVETARIADEVLKVSEEDLRSRFNPQAMNAADIYPSIWDRDPKDDDTLGYVVNYYNELRTFLKKAKEDGCGLVVSVG